MGAEVLAACWTADGLLVALLAETGTQDESAVTLRVRVWDPTTGTCFCMRARAEAQCTCGNTLACECAARQPSESCSCGKEIKLESVSLNEQGRPVEEDVSYPDFIFQLSCTPAQPGRPQLICLLAESRRGAGGRLYSLRIEAAKDTTSDTMCLCLRDYDIEPSKVCGGTHQLRACRPPRRRSWRRTRWSSPPTAASC